MSILLSENGVMINGKSVVLLASSFFYFRIPREKWEPRMKLLRLAGYNAIDVYFPWNYHELAPGQWDFEGQKDINAFLCLAKEYGFYVIARPGPYICSEWDGGALPAWLNAKNLPVRQDDDAFLSLLFGWYNKIIPILSGHQLDNGGNIILLQIENELDFFSCKSPASYMDKLRRKAIELGVCVPTFYCCGQNDISRAGGPLKDTYPTFNVYSSDNDPFLEERALHLRQTAALYNSPFLVSETNRVHGFLKRLLGCGAKLLSPYNQTGGTTMEFFAGISNWGPLEAPVSYMASNYDFNSMIGCCGEVIDEFYTARILAGILNTFSEDLANAKPIVNTLVNPSPAFAMQPQVPILQMDNGAFFPMSNLSENALCEQVIVLGETLNFSLPSGYTALMPLNIDLALFGAKGKLLCSNYEIFSVENSVVFLCGEGEWQAVFEADAVRTRIAFTPTASETITQCGLVFCPMSFMDAAKMATPFLAAVPDALSTAPQKVEAYLTGGVAFDFAVQSTKASTVDYLEKNDIYRGFGAYEIAVPHPARLLLHDAADLIEVSHNKNFAQYFYSPGAFRTIDVPQGTTRLLTEIWGHSNFDDLRLPVLSMDSMKGISAITEIKQEINLSANWRFRLEDLNFNKTPDCHYNPADIIMGIDTYNRGLSPMCCVYSKLVDLQEQYDRFILQFGKAECIIRVYINGTFVKQVSKASPYVDISSFVKGGVRCDITLHTLRNYFSERVGDVVLLCGNALKNCKISEAKLPNIVQNNKVALNFPVYMKKGEKTAFGLSVQGDTNADFKLICKGQGIKYTFVKSGFVFARILPQNDEMPSVKGGERALVYLPGEWLLQDDITVYCQAISNNAYIEPFDTVAVTWVF